MLIKNKMKSLSVWSFISLKVSVGLWVQLSGFEPWLGLFCFVLGQDTLPSWCLSPPWVPVNIMMGYFAMDYHLVLEVGGRGGGVGCSNMETRISYSKI